MGSLQSSTLTWGNSWSSSPLLGTPLLPALTLSPAKNARLEQLPLLTVCCLMQALLSREKSLKLLSAPRLMTQQAVRQLLICGLVTWLPVSTTTLFLKLMSALVLVSARKPPSSPPVTGPVRSAPTSLQGLLTTWLLMKPSPKVLNICKENASVARTDTLTTAVPLSPPSSLWPCLSLLVSS